MYKLINVFANQQFRSFFVSQFWIADGSFAVGCKELKLGQSAQINQLFQFLNVISLAYTIC